MKTAAGKNWDAGKKLEPIPVEFVVGVNIVGQPIVHILWIY